MKRKDCISMYLKEHRALRALGDIDRRDKEEIKKLDESYKDKILELDEQYLTDLRRRIISRRYDFDNGIVSFGPDLWSIDILIDDVYDHYATKKAVDDLLAEDGFQKKRGSFRRRPFRR